MLCATLGESILLVVICAIIMKAVMIIIITVIITIVFDNLKRCTARII